MQIFNQAKAAGKEVFQVIERKSMIYTNREGKTLDLINGSIDINDVHFAYPSRKETLILQGFSLSIPAGKVVALVGSSGCGKSTIMSLITRFYDPIKGTTEMHIKLFTKSCIFPYLHGYINTVLCLILPAVSESKTKHTICQL